MMSDRSSFPGSQVGIPDPSPRSWEENEQKARQNASPQRQIHHQHILINSSSRKKAPLHFGIAQSEDQEHEQRHKGVDEVDATDFIPRQILRSLPLLAVTVENVQAFEGGDTVVQLSVAVGEAVCEGGEEAKTGTKHDKRCGEVLVCDLAIAGVGE